MERALSREDRIKKAQEIYSRRRNLTENENSIENINEQKRFRWIRKILMQILLSMCIYMFFSAAQDNTWKYSESIINKTREILSYNTDFGAYYNKVRNIFIKGMEEESAYTENLNEEDDKNNIIEESADLNEEKKEEFSEAVSGVSQMIEDAYYIKSKINMIKPVNGVITSKFGVRDDVGSDYHLGLDIGADKGTTILASMSGFVEVASGEGNYGNHIKIADDNIATLYAHCNSIFVKEGEYINQGQKIAEVGSTGYSTGPHLHFEIMYEDRYVDPELLLEF